MLQVQSPFQQFFDVDGRPLENGSIYIGTVNLNPETNPTSVYWDEALTTPAAQPIKTSGGFPVRNGTPARLYLPIDDYSITIKNNKSAIVATVLDATSFANLQSTLATSSGAGMIGWIQAGIGAVFRWVRDKLRETVSVKDFGAVGDGVADDTAAIQAAIDAAYTNYNKVVHVPCGIYKVTGRLTVTQGVMIVCEGSQGSNKAYGTVFEHYSNGSCFRWDGSGTQYTGTGGGLLNCLIVKVGGYSGGNAIEVINQSDTNRCGEMVFHNVLAYGLSGTGRWERGAVFDGTLTNTAGARGVRTVHMTKCRFVDVTTAGETVLLNQVTHFYAHGLAIDTGGGAAAGITMKGINDGVYLTALGAAGNFLIVANDATNSTDNLTIDGKVGGTFINNDTAVKGTVALGSVGGLVNKSKTLNMLLGKKPGASVSLAANLVDVTGDGTKYRIPFSTVEYDLYSNWGGNSFNVTVAGRYKVSLMVGLYDVAAAHTRCDLEVARTGLGPAKAWDTVINPYNGSAPSGASRFCSTGLEVTMECEFGDVITSYVTVSNGTKVIDLYGAATTYSFIAIEYLG